MRKRDRAKIIYKLYRVDNYFGMLKIKEYKTYEYSMNILQHHINYWYRGRHGRDRMVVDLQLPVQSVPIITKVVSSNPAHIEIYSIQHYVTKFVSDLR